MSVIMKRFKKEMSGILNWCIEGYRDYCENGLEAPEKVKAATESYRQESDMLGDFLEECCIQDQNSFCYSNELFTRYKQWIYDNDEFQEFKSSRKLLATIKERGFLSKQGKGNKTQIVGLGILQFDQ